MDDQRRKNMKIRIVSKLSLVVAACLMVIGFTVSPITPARADDSADARQLVEKSKLTFDTFMRNKDMGGFRDLLKTAKGVFISPQLLEGAFIFGVSGGSGVFVTRNSATGRWDGPAFYTVGGASFGLQAGGQASEVVMLAMTDRGVNALLSPSVKLGADVGVAAGPVGIGAAAATANVSADILTFALSKGLYAGISLDGSVVAVRDEWNAAYYKKPGVTTTDILIRGDVRNPEAAKLIAAVSKAAGGAKQAMAAPKKAAPSEAGGKYYEVKSGDSLYEIAKKHGTTVDELVKLNNLQDKKYIYPGEKILLP
jgi:lipid-binding SYLF domain-containing protein